MGIILSRFRKKKTTLEVLEGIEKTIKSVEEYRLNTEQRHKTIVGHLILYSVALYVLAAVLFYFCFFPASLYDQLLYITPLLLFPLIVVLLKRLVTWYYSRKISKNQNKLAEMYQQKKKLLDEVMDKETYKVARQILEKFAPDQLRKAASPSGSGPVSARPNGESLAVVKQGSAITASQSDSASMGGAGEVRRRVAAGAVVGPRAHSNSPARPVAATATTVGAGGAPMALRECDGGGDRETKAKPKVRMVGGGGGGDKGASPTALPLPRPILPRERSALDRMVEYLVGDGPSQRYALICANCHSHNGMALKEEFEYFAFRCCYCYHWNPARKQRPTAPRLESGLSSTHTSASELESNSSEDDEEVESKELIKNIEPSESTESSEDGLQSEKDEVPQPQDVKPVPQDDSKAPQSPHPAKKEDSSQDENPTESIDPQ